MINIELTDEEYGVLRKAIYSYESEFLGLFNEEDEVQLASLIAVLEDAV